MADLTDAAAERFGGTARAVARDAQPLVPPPDWREDDFVDVLILQAVPWMRAMIAAFGREAIVPLATERMGKAMRAFGQRAAEASDGTVSGRVARALAPIPPDALTIQDRSAGPDQASFTVARCRYAELMARIGARDLGPLLICSQDFAIAEGMGLRLRRSRTLMTDGLPCDFVYTLPGGGGPDDA